MKTRIALIFCSLMSICNCSEPVSNNILFKKCLVTVQNNPPNGVPMPLKASFPVHYQIADGYYSDSSDRVYSVVMGIMYNKGESRSFVEIDEKVVSKQSGEVVLNFEMGTFLSNYIDYLTVPYEIRFAINISWNGGNGQYGTYESSRIYYDTGAFYGHYEGTVHSYGADEQMATSDDQYAESEMIVHQFGNKIFANIYNKENPEILNALLSGEVNDQQEIDFNIFLERLLKVDGLYTTYSGVAKLDSQGNLKAQKYVIASDLLPISQGSFLFSPVNP